MSKLFAALTAACIAGLPVLAGAALADDLEAIREKGEMSIALRAPFRRSAS